MQLLKTIKTRRIFTSGQQTDNIASASKIMTRVM